MYCKNSKLGHLVSFMRNHRGTTEVIFNPQQRRPIQPTQCAAEGWLSWGQNRQSYRASRIIVGFGTAKIDFDEMRISS